MCVCGFLFSLAGSCRMEGSNQVRKVKVGKEGKGHVVCAFWFSGCKQVHVDLHACRGVRGVQVWTYPRSVDLVYVW